MARREQGKLRNDGSIITACTLDCPDACSLLVKTGPQGELNIRGNPDHPFTAGLACRKIRSLPKRLRSPNRILTPLLRDGKGWKTISWADALDICAGKIQASRKEPASILHVWGSGYKGVLPLVPRLFFDTLGASTRSGSLCNSAGVAACKESFGAVEMNDPSELLHSSGIVNWGKDFSRSSVHLAVLVRKARRRGTRVITITAGGDGNSGFSDAVVQIRPGTDRFLAAAIARLFLEKGRIEESIIHCAVNWPAFKALIGAYSTEDLARACGAPMESVHALFDFYSGPGPVATVIGWGLQRHLFGAENVQFINAAAFLSGNVGRPGGGAMFTNISMKSFNCSWATPPRSAPQRTFSVVSMGRDILNAKEPPVQMLWVNGCNIVNQAPDSQLTAQAFETIAFKVVVDAFMNDTAQLADLVLPCSLMLEQEDIVGSSIHNFINHARQAVDAPGEARTDYWIVSEVARRLAPPVILPDADECFRLSLESPFLKTSLEELRERGHAPVLRNPVAFEGMRFSHPGGKCRLPVTLSPEPPAPKDYPFRLMSLIRKEAIHSQILPEAHEKPTVAVSPKNPGLTDIDLTRPVFLASPLGRMEAEIRFDPELPPGIVVYRRGDWMKLGGGPNRLIESKATDLGQGAAFYSQYVRLEFEPMHPEEDL